MTRSALARVSVARTRPTPAVPSGQPLPHTPEELRQDPSYPLWVRARAGDTAAREELIVRYTPLVRYVVGRMTLTLPASMGHEDVLSAGTIGLIHAVDRFDPDQGVRFENWAIQRIRGSIIDTLRSLALLPRRVSRNARAVDEAQAQLTQFYGRAPTQSELAEELGVTPRELRSMLAEMSHSIVPLDQSQAGARTDGEVGLTLADTLFDPRQVSAADAVELNDLLGCLAHALRKLPERDRLVLNLYYHEELSVKEIARVLSLSESRISQIRGVAHLRLRTLLRNEHDHDCGEAAPAPHSRAA